VEVITSQASIDLELEYGVEGRASHSAGDAEGGTLAEKMK